MSGGEREGVAVVECHFRPKAQSRLMPRQQGLMVTVAAAIGLCYGVCTVAFSTRGFWGDEERSIGMLAFLFIPYGAGYTCCMINVFQRKEGVAIINGHGHGDAVFGWNFYVDPCRLMYCKEYY